MKNKKNKSLTSTSVVLNIKQNKDSSDGSPLGWDWHRTLNLDVDERVSVSRDYSGIMKWVLIFSVLVNMIIMYGMFSSKCAYFCHSNIDTTVYIAPHNLNSINDVPSTYLADPMPDYNNISLSRQYRLSNASECQP